MQFIAKIGSGFSFVLHVVYLGRKSLLDVIFY